MSRFLFFLVLTGCCLKAAIKPPADPLGRENPRSAITSLLEAFHSDNYVKASQYLDISQLPASTRASQGPELAKDLESLLNADSKFDPLRLTQDPQGPPGAEGLVTIATIDKDGKRFPLQLKLQPSNPLWFVSSATVALLPKLAPLPSTRSVIEARLPRFLVATEIADTPLWVWLALLIAAAAISGVVRLLSSLSRRAFPGAAWRGLHAWLEPALMFVAALAFRVAEEVVVPSAFARIFINRLLLLVVVAAIAWAMVNLIELFLSRIDAILNPRQRVVSRSLIYLARRSARVIIFIFAAIFVLDDWGLKMNTIIAGLGVGGIAIALAAQQTIANIFGGVSVIGDHPVLVGDFGNFGGVLGFVDDIGLRSTRIRTLSRTVVSIPNAAFAGMNLENYSERDKILFNPTLSIKRTTPKAQIERVMQSIASMLCEDRRIESVPTPVRISAISSAALSMELFCYVRTLDADEYYKVASELYMKVDDHLTAEGIELI